MHRNKTRLCCLALGFLAFTGLELSAATNVALPSFADKVQLHNLAGIEPTKDGEAIRLHRLPESIRDRLVEKNKSSGKTGADAMRSARHSEIRFVLREGEKVGNVGLTLSTTGSGTVTIYWGDVYSSHRRLLPAGKRLDLRPTGHGLMFNLMDKLPRGRFANGVCRIIVEGSEIVLHDIRGNVRPPTPDELAPVMLSYGTSITQGYNASRPDLQWNSLTARSLGYDLLNLGSSGTAFCEREMAEYMAQQPWSLAVLEISVNMVGHFETPEFQKRVSFMVNALAKSHPDAPIFCISILPWGVGHYWQGDARRKTAEYRNALKQIVETCGHKNVHYVHGPELLSFSGLYHDMLHPSDMGMIEISTKLTQIIRDALKDSGVPD